MGLTPEIARALKSTHDLIQLAKRDNSLYIDGVKSTADENNEGILDVAELADENSIGLEDLAVLLDDLETRVSALESKEE